MFQSLTAGEKDRRESGEAKRTGEKIDKITQRGTDIKV